MIAIEKNTKGTSLEFLGTVVSIDIVPRGKSLSHWLITVKVDNVFSGNFSRETFHFRVHSPAKSGLEVNKQYTIKAKPMQSGYSVDPYQWK